MAEGDTVKKAKKTKKEKKEKKEKKVKKSKKKKKLEAADGEENEGSGPEGDTDLPDLRESLKNRGQQSPAKQGAVLSTLFNLAGYGDSKDDLQEVWTH